MTYRIGFFLNLPQDIRRRENCIVVFNGKNFEFKAIPKRFFYDVYPEIPEYCIKEPVLYLENERGETLDACFIKDIPLRAAGELTNQGLELCVPFFSYGKSSNPCIGEHLTTGMYIRKPVDLTILKDGNDLFPLPDFNSFDWRKNRDEQLSSHFQMFFAHYVLCYTFLRKVAGTIHDDCLSLGLFTSYLDKPWHNYYLQPLVSGKKS